MSVINVSLYDGYISSGRPAFIALLQEDRNIYT